MNTEAQFWARVAKDKTGCWLWQGPRNPNGYGALFFRGSYTYAHRVAYLISKGEIPAGVFVCHTCDVRHCANPDHLWLGTHKDNMADMKAKGRNSRNGKPGELNPSAKLTRVQAEDIRLLYATDQYTQEQIGAMFGVSNSTVSLIVRGEKWNGLASQLHSEDVSRAEESYRKRRR